MNLEWAVAARPLEGQPYSGDAHAVAPFPGGVLVAVIDGLGHGEPARAAALAAVNVLEQQPSAPVDEQLRRCHARLKGTRGVVMSLARLDAARAELTWSGVGNVEGLLVHADPTARPRRRSLLVFGGVVGGSLAGIRTQALPLHQGDVLLFATDGVRPDFGDDLELLGDPKTVAQRVLLRFGRGTDDALVLVGRWLGGSA